MTKPRCYRVKGSSYIVQGDRRLRLRRITWDWQGLNKRVWEVSFDKGEATGVARRTSFTAAFTMAIYNTYKAARL